MLLIVPTVPFIALCSRTGLLRVSESARLLSSAFVYQALLPRPIHSNLSGVNRKDATEPLNSVPAQVKDDSVSRVDAISKTRTGIRLVYVGYIVAWFCFLFLVHTMNPPHRNVSSSVLIAFVVAAVYAVVVGFVMRTKLFRKSAEALHGDLRKALGLWRAAHILGFTCAMNVCIFGFVLKFLGSSWLVLGIFFGLSLGFLLLWRPRQLDVSDT